jgi:hypothetical protein
LVEHGARIRNGNLRCREEWDELVGAIELNDESIHHVQWEDVELWIQQQTDADRLIELAMTVRDDYVTSRDSFDMMETRMELCYVGAE